MGNHVEVSSHESESPADDNDESVAIPMEVDDEEEDKTKKRTSRKGKAKKEGEESSSEDEGKLQEYEVEKILKSRTVKDNKEYFVHWKGFPSSEDSWEPEANLGEGCEDLLKALKENDKKQGGGRGRTKSTPSAKSMQEENSSSKVEAEGSLADHVGQEDAGTAQPAVAEASASGSESQACQIKFMGQLLPRFDIAPYAEAFKHGLLPGARGDIIVGLEDVYSGCTQRMMINSDEFTHVIEVRVNAGTLAGHQWTYPLPDGDTITFTLKDARHARFRRDGSDLIYKQRLTLRDALLGARVNVQHFTGEVVALEFDTPVFNGLTKRIAGYGMPLPTKPWERGDLVVEFDVKFPDTVSDEHHDAIRQLL